jgi:acyl-CoA synthetase (NDP forming)
MNTLPESISSFLNADRIAVIGVSRNKREPSNAIFDRLRRVCSDVIPVHPSMDTYEGLPCYPDIEKIPEKPDAVFIATHPDHGVRIIEQCHTLGIRKVWFHRSIGDGSWSAEASEACKKYSIRAIEAGCPLMFVPPVDLGHACMRWWFQKTGKVVSS